MASIYEIGDAIPLTWAITVGGVATNATVTLTITLPDGTTSSPSITNGSTGNYSASYTPTLNGEHGFRWVATGAATAAESGSFQVGNGYTTLATLKASLGITDTTDDNALIDAIVAASRAIDAYTGTTFYPITEARTFDPDSPSDVWVDPFVTATSLVVKTGTDGTYPTTVDSSKVIPWPYNAVKHGRAWCRLIIANASLPCGFYWPTVQVTAAWGHASAPADVAEACRIKAAALFRRKDSPEGIAGSSEFGVVRISKTEDPDVARLLAPYVVVQG